MNFNYRAVTKKERLQKTLILGIPFTLISAVVLSFLLSAVRSLLNINVIYYIVVLGYGLIIGQFVKKVGKGTTNEFLVLAGLYAFIGICLGEFLSLYSSLFSIFGFFNALKDYFMTYVFAIPSVTNSYSLVVKAFVVVIAVQEAITVRSNDF